MAKRVALVTGGSRGIGRAIAVALTRDGISVVLTYNANKALADGVVREIVSIGGAAATYRMRVEDRDSVRHVIGEVRSAIGPIDILVNNAAVAQEKPFEEITDKDWDLVMGVNLRGAFACSQEVLPDMVRKGWGRVINITSIGGQWGGVNQVHYAVSKAGLIGLTKSLAKVYGRNGITANAVAPGLVDTDMAAGELETPAGLEKVKNIPIGRIATCAEVAHAVSFLASDRSGSITGQTINVNGGMYFG
ncbi:MAG: 3-oxoacyl-ACP reductase FabG [Deltaproteobacteria bacterium]|nr:3-oxoacyl-ACP reductase FabG [Deltaproteobacteria bacterium]